MELSAGCRGEQMVSLRVSSGAEGAAAREHLRTSTTPPFPVDVCVRLYDHVRQLECVSDFR